MNKFLLLVAAVIPFMVTAQGHQCAQSKQKAYEKHFTMLGKPSSSGQIAHEMAYDVKFVHLDLEMERNNKYVKGNVKSFQTVTVTALDTFMCLLHQNFTIDSILVNGTNTSWFRQDSMIKSFGFTPFANGITFTTQVFYKGTAPTGGAAIGSGLNTGTSGSWGNQATWSLSESFVAYHWWPCKQALTDKIDSSWVYVTTDSANKVGSNGLLQNIVLIGNKKRFEWKSRNPIDYYLISVAIAKYKEYRQYAKPQYLLNDSILIQNYIYDNAINNNSWINNQKVQLDKMPQMMNFLCDLYGMYPFYKEKYGHCMAPFSGGMEHQTMTSLGFFEYYLDAHELGHQWWGDNVTCKTWGDIWINEGFASYTEHLVAEYLDPPNFASNLNAAHQNVMSQPGGSIFFTGSDTMKTSRIFSSRLTYDKGGAIVHSLRFLTNNDSLWFGTLRGFQNLYKESTASAIDFQNYYQSQTGINPAVFFNQWYYGEGYPTFAVKYHSRNGNLYLQTTQSTSMPMVTPLFITPLEYRVIRLGKADTVIRVNHNLITENYFVPVNGTVSAVVCDPNNWIINKSTVVRDTMLGYVAPPVDPVGLSEEAQFKSILVGPNPCREEFTVQADHQLAGTAKLFDLNGRLVLEKHLGKETAMRVDHLSKGIYLLKIYDKHGSPQQEQKIKIE